MGNNWDATTCIPQRTTQKGGLVGAAHDQLDAVSPLRGSRPPLSPPPSTTEETAEKNTGLQMGGWKKIGGGEWKWGQMGE